MRFTAAALLLGLAPVGAAPVISELMFHPPHTASQENSQEEWLELYNPGPDPVDLTDWQIGGVSFTFPNVTIAPNDYLVVAADVQIFQARHPRVKEVVGDWLGRLSNRGEAIVLRNHLGDEVDRVEYADGGDWALRRPGPDDRGHTGWIWHAPADGGGKSLELRNLWFSNSSGQNWAASIPDRGTPGEQNSTFALNIPPLIEDVSHYPAVPGPNDLVLVRARLTDDLSSAYGVVHHRVSSPTPGAFLTTALRDDGLAGDELAGDGIHSAVLPAQADGTVVEFYLEAFDRIQSRRWPGPTSPRGAQKANLLYQVDAEVHTGREPFYRIVLSASENDEFNDIPFDTSERNTNARFNATFIAQLGDEFTTIYRCGMRIRGSGSRSRYPRSLKVELPSTQSWQGDEELNLNSQFTYNQLLGSLFYREAGLPAYESKAVQVRMNGFNHAAPENDTAARPFERHYGLYVHNEPINSQFANMHYPLNPSGNLYRMAGGGNAWDYFPNSEDLAADYTAAGWDKETNTSANDWRDLHIFVGVMTNASGLDYLEEVEAVMDLESWLRSLAVSTILTNSENSLFTGTNDDYAVYCSSTGQFKLLPHDLDTVLGQGDGSSIKIGDLPHTIFDFIDRGDSFAQLEALFEQPEVVQRYYKILAELLAGPFEESRANTLIDDALTWTPRFLATNAKDFLAARRADILSVIQGPLTASSPLPMVDDYRRTTDGNADLSGSFNAADAAAVHVNGQPAALNPNTATWSFTATGLHPGINRLVVEERDPDSNVLATTYLDVYYDDGDTRRVAGSVPVNTIFDAAGGPWIVIRTLVVASGRTLNIEPGASVFFRPGAGIEVRSGGTLRCEGTLYDRIRLTRPPGSKGTWEGLKITAPPGQSSLSDNVISFTDMEYGDEQGEAILLRRSRLTLDHDSWDNSTGTVLELRSPRLEVRDCVFPSVPSSQVIHGNTLTGDDYLILRRNLFVPSSAYNDIIDFTGGQRPGPILTAYDNIFTGATDDCFELDDCDAHLEGNIFMHGHLNISRNTTSNAIAANDDSHITVVRNLFYDVDHAVLLKNGASCVFENNTVVQATIAALNLDEPLRPRSVPAKRIDMDSNLFVDCSSIFAHPVSVPPEPDPIIVGHRNNLPAAHLNIGVENLDLDPFLGNLSAGPWPKRNWALLPGSPAIGSGQNRADRGALVPRGANLSGLPAPITALTAATLLVDGPGVVEYRWRLVTEDAAGLWSPPTGVGAPIQLSGLAEGRYSIDLLAKDTAGYWQDPGKFTSSRRWRVDFNADGALLINEIQALPSPGIDFVELRNGTGQAISLDGWFLTDDPFRPTKVPLTGVIGSGSLRTFFDQDSPGLSASGETLHLFHGATLVDSISWGMQVVGFSIGRVGPPNNWSLTTPTPDSANRRAGLAPIRDLKINEWLTDNQVRYGAEFVELFNPGDSPAPLGGLWFSDSPDNPLLHQLPAHSYVPPRGFVVLRATGDLTPSADELPFTLDSFHGWLLLTDARGATIDQVPINCLRVDTVEGRNPDGSDRIETFSLGTPGRSNTRMNRAQKVSTLLSFESGDWSYLDVDDPASTWNTLSFDDATWKVGPAPLGRETTALPVDLATDPNSNPAFNYSSSRKNYYFRRTFQFTGDPIETTLTLATYLDDGAVFYLNGHEIYRHNILPGVLNENTWADQTITNADFAGPFLVRSLDLVEGSNILAVVTYQAAPNSSDIVFDCQLTASELLPALPDPIELALQDLLDFLRITEVMYNPPDGNDAEFIELQNISDTVTLDLTGVRFTKGIKFTFPPVSLAPGEHIVVINNQHLFEIIHGRGLNVAGEFEDSRFDNGSEEIALTLPEPFDVDIQRFVYRDLWHSETDGFGRSLELRDPNRPLVTWNEASAWIASHDLHGSPAVPNSGASFASWTSALGTGLRDTDGDSLSDPLEYAFGLDALEPNFVSIPYGLDLKPGEGLTSTFLIPAVAPPDAVFHLQSSLDMENWTTQATRIANGPWIGTGQVESVQPGSGFGVVLLHIPDVTPELFTRLLVEISP